MDNRTATYTKLRSGEWGVKIAGTVRRGDVVTAHTKSGEQKQVTIANVVWTGDGITIAAIRDSAVRVGYSGARRSTFGGGSAAPVAGYSSYCTDRPGCGCYDCAS